MERGLEPLAGIEPATLFLRALCQLSYNGRCPARMPRPCRAKGENPCVCRVVPPEGLEPSALLMR